MMPPVISARAGLTRKTTLPLLQGAQVVVTGTDISGAVLDASFKFRFGSLVKN